MPIVGKGNNRRWNDCAKNNIVGHQVTWTSSRRLVISGATQAPKTYAKAKNGSKGTDYKDTDKDKYTKSKLQRKRWSHKRTLDKKKTKTQSPSGCLLVVCYSVKSYKGNAWQYFENGNAWQYYKCNAWQYYERRRENVWECKGLENARLAAALTLPFDGFVHLQRSATPPSPFQTPTQFITTHNCSLTVYCWS